MMICAICKQPIEKMETCAKLEGMVCRTIRLDFFRCGWRYGCLWEDLWDHYAVFGNEDDDDDETGPNDWLKP